MINWSQPDQLSVWFVVFLFLVSGQALGMNPVSGNVSGLCRLAVADCLGAFVADKANGGPSRVPLLVGHAVG